MTQKLARYRAKRDFSRTPEPSGSGSQSRKTLLYGIQKHDATRLHYDFRIEHDGAMMSWAVPKEPSLDPGEKRLAVHVEDHPIDYTKFEGTIPKGEYGAGTVVWDTGSWEPLGDVDAMLKKGVLKFELSGERLRGAWALVRMHKDEENWLLIKERDSYAVDGDADGVVRRFTTSALRKELPKAALDPHKFEPQLATLGDRVPPGSEWVHEVKYDGYRIVAWARGGKVSLLTRNGHDWSARFPGIKKALEASLPNNTCTDGEIVVLDEDGASDFGALQAWLKSGKGPAPICFMFDLLELRSKDLTSLPLLVRKSELVSLMQDFSDESKFILRYSEHILGQGPKFYEKACRAGLEGIMSKKASAPYVQGRGTLWIKSKCVRQEEFVIGGYTKPGGEQTGFGALLLGQFSEGNLVYSGKVGTGFREDDLRDLITDMDKLKTNTYPFSINPSGPHDKVTWIRPKLVAEVRYSERTAGGILRHPVFVGMRGDKDASEVKPEMKAASRLTVNITHPDRVLFPEIGLTKAGLAEYYQLIGPHMLPYVKGRPLAVFRCPEGVSGECFIQKHGTNGMPSSVVKQMAGEVESVIAVDSVDGLIHLVQFGIVEFHIWGSHLATVEKPDMLVFDLDPAPDVDWKIVVQAAAVVGEYLRSHKLTPFLKTTGGKGFHVVVPVKPGSVSWEDFKGFAKHAAEDVDHLVPGRFVTVMTKSKRKGKIFIDYLRNGRGATSVAPYSARARPGAPVSCPVSWDKLDELSSADQFSVLNVEEWMPTTESDPWKEFTKASSKIPKYSS